MRAGRGDLSRELPIQHLSDAESALLGDGVSHRLVHHVLVDRASGLVAHRLVLRSLSHFGEKLLREDGLKLLAGILEVFQSLRRRRGRGLDRD